MIFKQILKQHLRCIQLYTIYMILERIQKESKKNEDGQEGWQVLGDQEERCQD
jgi:hypothetical protein